MKFIHLERLKQLGTIDDFKHESVPSPFKDGSRETERLTLIFPDGESICFETWCSGCLENTGFSAYPPSEIK